MGELRVISADGDYAVAVWRDAILFNWRRVTRPSAVADCRAASRIALEQGGGRGMAFGMVEPAAELPSSDVRAQLVEFMREPWSANLVVSALSYEGSGFKASAVRNVAIGMSLLARHPYPHRVFGSVAAAAHWVTEMRVAAGLTGSTKQELLAALDLLRRTNAA